MLRLVDQPRPIVWAMARHVSRKYQFYYEQRHLDDVTRIVLRRALFVPEHRLLYVRNAKAASSTLRDFVVDVARAGAGEGRKLRSGPKDWDALLPALTDPAVYRFTFVRDPAARAVSSFFNMFVDRNNGFEWRHIPYAAVRGLRFGDASSANFDRYLDYVEEVQAESDRFCDTHLRKQIHNIGYGKVQYDFVGKSEAVAEELMRMAADANLVEVLQHLMPAQVNRSSREKSSFALSREQRSRIEQAYAEDYEAFGY